MRLLIADNFNENTLQSLGDSEVSVIYRPDIDGTNLEAALAHERPDVLIVHETPVPSSIIEATDHLSLIIRTAPTVETIDVQSASDNGIGVAHTSVKTPGFQRDEEAAAIVLEYRDTGRIRNAVNLQKTVPASELMLMVRHLDRPGVLAAIFTVLSKANINVNETENLVFSGGKAACAHIRIEGELTDATLKLLARAHDALIAVSVMGIAGHTPRDTGILSAHQ